ncbi:TRM11 family SAM-dependent methyltransferase [Streptomyces sp. SBT349]|uniref:TRM11 family SAM-dependent methyltransferase n=1 Tax=Streptomyces sp. SBT349 TaxID=1580539 RepID=UPI00066BF9AD|nr:DNA methyltransferase [Streptomyces sp. SBT349]
MPYSVWNTAPTSAPHQRQGRYLPGSSAHPAKMLPAIAAHAIRRYTQPGDLVLDPMCGIGTTLVEAIHLGRHAVGTEYERRWADVARANLHHAMDHMRAGRGEVVQGDARHLDTLLDPSYRGEAALVVTSPPYGDSAHGHVRSTGETGTPGVTKRNARYGRDPRNLAHASTDHLLAAFTHILRQATLFLRPGGTVAVTARPWRQRGELIDLPTAVLAAGRHAGLIPVERCAALLAGIRDDHLVLRPSFFQMKNIRDARRQGLPLHLIAQEDVLIFRKPGTHTPARTQRTRPRRSTPSRTRVRTCAAAPRHGRPDAGAGH